MRFLNKLSLCLVLGTLIAGCASPGGGGSPANNSRMNAVMASWKGHRVTEAVGMWGMPDSIGREGMLGVLQWKSEAPSNSTSPSWTPPMMQRPDGSQPWPTRCGRVLMVDPAEIIQQARWFGSDCSMDPADYAPPG